MCAILLFLMVSYTLIVLQLLDVVLESYFDGRLFKNKIWVGTVEGQYLSFILVFICYYHYYLFI